MIRPPLGEILVRLGLLTKNELASVLERAGEGSRLGQTALEIGVLDEEGLARALAVQCDAGFVSANRLSGLEPSAEALGILPSELMRRGPILPTFRDEASGVVSLLVADPTDTKILAEAREATRASDLKLYVVPRTPLLKLLDRALERVGENPKPEAPLELAPSPHLPRRKESLAILLDSNAQRLGALKQLDLLEGRSALYASTADQVTDLLDNPGADRLYYRPESQSVIDERLDDWRKKTPHLHVAEISSYGPASHPGAPHSALRDFLMGLLEFLLIASEQENFVLRARIRRKSQLCRQLGVKLQLPPHERDALLVATLLADLPEMTRFKGLLADETRDRRQGGRFEASRALMSGLTCPLPVLNLLTALEDRLTGEEEVSKNVGAEILFTLGAYLARGENPRSTVRQILGPDAPRHTLEVLDALERVLEAEATEDDSTVWARKDKVASRTVILAERDATLLTALELRLTRAGFQPVTVPDGTQALARIRNLHPAGVVANLRLPGKDGLSLVMDIRSDPTISATPVILLTNRSSAADVERGMEMGADAVLEKPINVAELTERLRQIIQVRLGE